MKVASKCDELYCISDSDQAAIRRLKHVIQQGKPAQKGERDHRPLVSSIPMSTPTVTIAPVTAI